MAGEKGREPAAGSLAVTHAVYARAVRIPTPVTGVGLKTGRAQLLSKGLARRRMSFLHATAVPAPPIPLAGTSFLGEALYAAFLLSARRAFIIADNFFRMAALIGFRPVDFLETVVAFLGPCLPFCCAHQAFFAAPILARAAALIRRRFCLLAGFAWLTLGGRPRRAGWKPNPASAAIAVSIRPRSCLS